MPINIVDDCVLNYHYTSPTGSYNNYIVIPTPMEKSGEWSSSDSNANKHRCPITDYAFKNVDGLSKWYDNVLHKQFNNMNIYRGNLDYYIGFALDMGERILTLPVCIGTFDNVDNDILARSLDLLRTFVIANSKKNVNFYVPMLSDYYPELSEETVTEMYKRAFFGLEKVIVVKGGGVPV